MSKSSTTYLHNASYNINKFIKPIYQVNANLITICQQSWTQYYFYRLLGNVAWLVSKI
jgi:hypothetical protein